MPGPRQTGKTTIDRQVAETVSFPVHLATADEPTLRDRNWLIQQWETARLKLTGEKKEKGALLVLMGPKKLAIGLRRSSAYGMKIPARASA
jgi:hypothetical protein